MFSFFATIGCANSTPPPEKVDAHGAFDNDGALAIEVGAAAPDFTLTASDGALVTLSIFRGTAPVLLVFYRGGWCPYCIDQLEDYRRVLPDLRAHQVQLIAISPESIEKNRAISERLKTGYLFLSDAKHEAIKRYGIAKNDELPHPTMVLIDVTGAVVWFYSSADYTERPSAEQLRGVLEAL